MSQLNSISPSRHDVAARLYDLFARGGAEGVSLSDISRATGLAKSSLYHHFPGGKADMVVAVLDLAIEQIEIAVAPLRRAGTRAERIDHMLECFDDLSAGGFKPCVLASLLIGVDDGAPRRMIKTAVAHWIEAIVFALTDTGVEPVEAQHRAAVAVMQLEGAFLVTRALGERAVFQQACAAVREMLLR